MTQVRDIMLSACGGVADPTLTALASRYATARYSSLAPGTLRKHIPSWRRFTTWVAARNPPFHPLGVPGAIVALYLLQVQEDSARDNIGPSRVNEASAAIASQYQILGLYSPTSHPACTVVREAANRTLQARHSARDELTIADIRLLVDTFCAPAESSTLMDLMHATTFLLMYAACIRFDEASEIAVDPDFMKFLPEYALIFIVKSKTDQRKVGRWIPILAVGGPYCPVMWLQTLLRRGAYVRTKPAADPDFDCGPLVRAVQKRGSGHVLKRLSGSRSDPIPSLGASRLGDRCKAMCRIAGIDRHITLHSCRGGAASTAADAGASTFMLRHLGGWRLDAMPNLYAKADLRAMLHVRRYLGLGE
jgi:cleavage and polyadenylation specificity factor subunit 1